VDNGRRSVYPHAMIRRMYDWMMQRAADPRAPRFLFWIAFIESSIFPIPPDVMLVPMVLANRMRAWAYAAICTVGSVLGGLAGYAIGYYLLEYVGQPVLRMYGLMDRWDQLAAWFQEWGVWVLLIKGPTPFPFKVLTIFAGASHMNLIAFVAASVLSRALRFYIVSGLLYMFGEPIRDFIEKRLNMVATVFALVLIGGFIAIRYVI
jgi:membrane protein YqaA with SNARE-associated domain